MRRGAADDRPAREGAAVPATTGEDGPQQEGSAGETRCRSHTAGLRGKLEERAVCRVRKALLQTSESCDTARRVSAVWDGANALVCLHS